MSVEAYLSARGDVAKARDELSDLRSLINGVTHVLASDPGSFRFVKQDCEPTSLDEFKDLDACRAVRADRWPNPEQIMQVLTRYLATVEHLKHAWGALPTEMQAILKAPDDLFPPRPAPPPRTTWSP